MHDVFENFVIPFVTKSKLLYIIFIFHLLKIKIILFNKCDFVTYQLSNIDINCKNRYSNAFIRDKHFL